MITSIVTRIRDRAQQTPRAVAMRRKELGVWREYTWADYWDEIELAGHALIALGVEPGDRVSLQSDGRPEWLFLDLATVAAGGITVGVYPTNPAEEVRYLLSHSGAKVHLAEDQEQLDKALEVRDQCPDLTHLVYVEPRGITGRYEAPGLTSYDAFRALGEEHRAAHPGAVAERMEQAAEDDVITLVYTSGTTGAPKGAMLTHRNVEWAMGAVVESGGFADPPPNPKDLCLSYLPLCHVAERTFTTWFNAHAGIQVQFAESIETVPQNLREVQPTLILGVPRIWEKLLAAARIRLESATLLKRWWARVWMRRAAWIGNQKAANGGRHTVASRLVYAIGWLVFYRALLDRLGLRRVRHAVCGAAPVAPEVLVFFMGIGVPMHEVYGMTENTAVATANRRGRVRVGTVGEPQEGAEVRIDEETGEILTRHPAVFAGYWRNEAATADAVDNEGWLHTGDVGEWVDGTHVRITDRMKDIIITAGGKNISPSEIENRLKASPFIKEAVVIGDGRAYLTALVGIELDTVAEWAAHQGLGFTTYRDLSEKAEVIALVDRLVQEVNAQHSPVEQIKRFTMLPKELDHEDGELTATQKVKRSAINQAFGELIDAMYAGAGARG